MDIKFFDTHSHLNDIPFKEDLEETVERMKELRLGSITVGTDRQMSERAVELSEKYENLWATVGLHPTDNTEEVFDEEVYESLARKDKVVAIGECGLDYFWLSDKEDREEIISKQKERFIKQIKLANKVSKPLMLHVRDVRGEMGAYEDAIEILKEHAKVLGNVHFFTGTKEIAKRFNEMNYTVSFPGVITFAKELEEVVKSVPSDMYMIETDSPYAAPVPHRGKRNEPVFVDEVAKKVSEIRGEDYEKVLSDTLSTTKRLFAI